MPLVLCSLAGASVGSITLTPAFATLTGALIVVLAVLLLWSVRMLVAVNRRLHAIETSAPKSSEPIPGEVVAAISAAAIATLGSRARIVSLSRSMQESHAWSVEGRRHIFHSHNPR